MDEHDLRRALMERSEAPSAPFRAALRAAFLEGRPARTVVPWVPIVAVLLLLALPVAVLLGTRSLSREGPSRSPSSIAVSQPGSPQKISMTGGGHGWAVLVGPATSQTSLSPLRVARTVDSGATWETVRGLGPGLVDSLQGIDDRDAVMLWQPIASGKGISAQDQLLTTADGGLSWQSEPMPDPVPFAAPSSGVSFISPRVGWIIVDHVISGHPNPATRRMLLHTIDGGRTWDQLGIFPDAAVVRFVDAQNGWLGGFVSGSGGAPDLRTTHDGGHSWQQVSLESPP